VNIGNWRRKFFDEFAHDNQFDPLDAEKWYHISKNDVINAVSYFILLVVISLNFLEGRSGVDKYL
jgi:hypothetical protein